MIGTEIAGATKNVIAVAIGAAEGLGLGINTRSTLMTRGLAEMTRLGTAWAQIQQPLRARRNWRLNRNLFDHAVQKFCFGHRVGTGMSVEEALAASAGVVEGVASAIPILQLAQSIGVDMPITTAVVEVVEGRAGINDMGNMLLSRPRKMDGWKIELV